jgi:hypothetical protein
MGPKKKKDKKGRPETPGKQAAKAPVDEPPKPALVIPRSALLRKMLQEVVEDNDKT